MYARTKKKDNCHLKFNGQNKLDGQINKTVNT